ncbi:MAG TPA: CpsB/CapC family capsule biosynthesis tyrosine phosphatase [Proteiniclasticum sp.]|nr:CpsB/CapC family capsule biosynthesis tyrosine phosphatase [Proteiniclasticum sp.]
MVDLHSHVLYDVDDGSENLDMSMKMIEQSIREGVKILALTPHHIRGLFTDAMDHKKDYAEKLDFLQKKYEGKIELVQSLEIMIDENIFEDLENGVLIGYDNTKTVLVEFNLLDYPLYSESIFYKMKKHGYQVIMAHPERNKALMEDPEKIYHLHDLGVLFQLNAGSLFGQFGKKTENFAKELIMKNLIHAIGSYGHRDVRRDMRIRHAYEAVKEMNETLYESIMQNGPKLIHGEKVEVLPYKPWTEPLKVKKRKKKKKSLLDYLKF